MQRPRRKGMWLPALCGVCLSATLSWPFALPLGSTLPASLETLRRLKAQLGALRLPVPKSVWVYGKEEPLPCTAVPDPDVAKKYLHYLVGFFAGHGIVSAHVLQVRQQISGASSLFLFLRSFGGLIEVCKGPSGTHAPVLQWRVHSPRARRAAEALSCSKLSRKHNQLLAHCSAYAFDLECAEGFTSWEMAAGFFDASACLLLDKNGAVRLEMKKKDPQSLVHFQNFLRSHSLQGTSLKLTSGRFYTLTAYGPDVLFPILHKLLAVGLMKKRAQAELVLCRTRDNAWIVKEWLQCFKGQVKLFIRQDAAGDGRSRAISNFQNKLRQLQNAGAPSTELDALTAQITLLKEEHHQLELERQIGTMEGYLSELAPLAE